MKNKNEPNRIYIHSSMTIWSDNGEVYIETENGDIITFYAKELFTDLPTLAHFCIREQKKENEMIKTEFKNLEI